MSEQTSLFSDEQWSFLAALDFLGRCAPVGMIEALAPLSPSRFLDLIEKGGRSAILERVGPDSLRLKEDLPGSIEEKLRPSDDPYRYSEYVDRLEAANLLEKLNSKTLLHIYEKSGRAKEASELELKMAIEAMQEGRYEDALELLRRVNNRCSSLSRVEDSADLVKAVFRFSHLCYITGKGLDLLPEMLGKVRDIAAQKGDRRSVAFANLHLGRVLHFADKRREAMEALEAGCLEAESLGDSDIIAESSEFLAFYYFNMGRFEEASRHSERAIRQMEAKEKNGRFSTLMIILFGLSMAFLGLFHKAIGFLDYEWRLTKEAGNQPDATIFRAILGTLLAMSGRSHDASYHLQNVRKEALLHENGLGLFYAGAATALQNFMQGKIEEAKTLLTDAFAVSARYELIHQYTPPFFHEMIHEFERLGYGAIDAMPFDREFRRTMEEPNIHARGVMLRLKARQMAFDGGDAKEIEKNLKASEECLARSGDPVQLAKTWLSMARTRLCRGNRTEAVVLARKAHFALSGHTEVFFPDDLRYLLEQQEPSMYLSESKEDLVKRFFGMLEELLPSKEPGEILIKTVSATNRLFCAERGGLFWLDREKPNYPPKLLAGCNLTSREVESEGFQPYLDLVKKSMKSGQPLLIRLNTPRRRQNRAALCLPIEEKGKVRGVLYHDNYFIKDCFDFLDMPLLQKLTQLVTTYVTRIQELQRSMKETVEHSWDDSLRGEKSAKRSIVAQSPSMMKTLRDADNVAALDASVLILGETGVGKELLAERLHKMSARRSKPFVVVDLATIPESLVESELFGYEKGAFTGADRQKPGRIEMAHHGTLFVDELGEIPKSLQVKLLRTLQEKTITRIGGSRPIKVDFRLIAATNRDLAAEVAAGRFREDLYYRINVVALTIPSLRERREDIPLLIRHYIDYFSAKHNRQGLYLEKESQTALTAYDWPGNVRELRNVVERAVILSQGKTLELDLPIDRKESSENPFANSPTLDEVQRRYIRHVLERTGGRIAGPDGAAEILGLKRTTLIARMKKLGIE